MADLTERNVLLPENLEMQRKPFPSYDVVYFLTPTETSVSNLVRDWATPADIKYNDAYVFFTTAVAPELMGMIGACTNLVQPAGPQRLKCLVELHLEFLVPESKVFHLALPEALRLYSNPVDPQRPPPILVELARRLASVCVTLGDWPLIRYSPNLGQNPTHMARVLAEMTQYELDMIMRRPPPDYPRAQREGAQPTTLLILDRSVDPITPLVHDFASKPMAYDLLGDQINGNVFKYSYENKNRQKVESTAILDDTDALWREYSYTFFAHAMELVSKRQSDFAAAHPDGLKAGNLAENPLLTQQYAQLRTHVTLTNMLLEAAKEKNLLKVGNCEQDMASGTTAEGSTTLNLNNKMKEIIADSKSSQMDLQRLILLYLMTKKDMKEADKRDIIARARIPADVEQCVFNKLRFIGGSGRHFPLARTSMRARGVEEPLVLMRYVPYLKHIIEKHFENDRSVMGDYPFVRDPGPGYNPGAGANRLVAPIPGATSLRSDATREPGWGDRGRPASSMQPQPPAQRGGARLVVFVLGGVAYSELRVVHELSSSYDIIVGGSSLVTPNNFVELMRLL
eukprot:gnl/Spiro4/4676_TR2332_c0_g1_i1.p1 gnl/Spiro4/4676_TR2332_c0_g1~~gnl/Spiro4/4676_TR2332_c0_g1_i1.p1  ORF type:complete len:649 (+),score=182.31 gnl/Spiro4/4676_TR2332_c0_g1_i1:242-1948(+)